jgi:hypothetical protein
MHVEESIEDRGQGIKYICLPAPWDEVAMHIMRYITCEGRHNMVIAYHLNG